MLRDILKRSIVLIGLAITINSYADDDIISSPAEDIEYIEVSEDESVSEYESESESEYESEYESESESESEIYEDHDDIIDDNHNSDDSLLLVPDPTDSESGSVDESSINDSLDETLSPTLSQEVIEGLLELNEQLNNNDTNLIIESVVESESDIEKDIDNYGEENEMDSTKLSESNQTSGGGFIESIKNILLKNEDEPVEIHLAGSPSMVKAAGYDSYHKNVVVYHGTFNNQQCDLVIPYSGYSSLDIINSILVNVGTSSVTGRILYNNDNLSPSDYDTYSYIMNPIYGSTSNVYNYGSFNYRRHYYLNTSSGYNRITYDDMYGNFYVDSVDIYYSASERVYYLLLVIFLFMGVNALWSRKH